MYSWMTIQGTDYRRLRTAEALTPRAADQAQPAPSLDGAPLRRERRARDAGHQLWRQRGKRLPADAASGRKQASTLAHFELLALARRPRLEWSWAVCGLLHRRQGGAQPQSWTGLRCMVAYDGAFELGSNSSGPLINHPGTPCNTMVSRLSRLVPRNIAVQCCVAAGPPPQNSSNAHRRRKPSMSISGTLAATRKWRLHVAHTAPQTSSLPRLQMMMLCFARETRTSRRSAAAKRSMTAARSTMLSKSAVLR